MCSVGGVLGVGPSGAMPLDTPGTSMLGFSRKRRAGKNDDDAIDDGRSTFTSRVKPSLRAGSYLGIVAGNKDCKCLKEHKFDEIKTPDDAKRIAADFLTTLPKEMRARVRFCHVGPGSRLLNCDVRDACSHRPDVIYAAREMCRRMSAPTDHQAALKRMVRYLHSRPRLVCQVRFFQGF